MKSEGEGGEASGESHGDDLQEGTGTLEVGESDIDVSELGAVRVELKLSGSGLRAYRLRIAVLNTGDGNPEVSVDSLA